MTADSPDRPVPAWRAQAARLSLFYGAYFLIAGVLSPFWPMFLSGRGLDAGQIGLLLGVNLWVRTIAGPLAARAADAIHNARAVIFCCALAALATACSLFGVTGYAAIFGLSTLFYFLLSGIMPLTEAITLRATEAHQGYGRIRLWGSISFVGAALASGIVLQFYGRLSPDTVLWLVIVTVGLVVLVSPTLPPLNPPHRGLGKGAFRALMSSRPFLLMIASAGLIHGAHAVQVGFGSLHWKAAGYPDWLIGALWAEGSVAEIALFAFGGPLIGRLGASRLLVIAGVLGALRWLAFGLSTDLAVVAPMQLLHAANFGAMHMGAMLFISRAIPPGHANMAQSLYSGITVGALMGGSMLLAGLLYRSDPATAYFAAAALSIVGAGAALLLGLVWHREPQPKPAA
jgi:PPP family 3-phenylpropionic acid transporter